MFQFNANINRKPTAVRTLVLANIAVFILQKLFFEQSISGFTYKFGFIPSFAFDTGYLWQLGTHMFLHGDLWHIVFNLFALYIFGSHLEKRIGKSRFFVLYFLSGVGAALFYSLLKYNTAIPMIGASGAVMGIAAGFAYFFPNALLLVFGIIPVKAWKLLLFYAFFELLNALNAPHSPIAHAAHFGGLIASLIFLQIFYRKYHLFGKRSHSKGDHSKQKEEDDNVIELEKDKDGWWQ